MGLPSPLLFSQLDITFYMCCFLWNVSPQSHQGVQQPQNVINKSKCYGCQHSKLAHWIGKMVPLSPEVINFFEIQLFPLGCFLKNGNHVDIRRLGREMKLIIYLSDSWSSWLIKSASIRLSSQLQEVIGTHRQEGLLPHTKEGSKIFLKSPESNFKINIWATQPSLPSSAISSAYPSRSDVHFDTLKIIMGQKEIALRRNKVYH